VKYLLIPGMSIVSINYINYSLKLVIIRLAYSSHVPPNASVNNGNVRR